MNSKSYLVKTFLILIIYVGLLMVNCSDDIYDGYNVILQESDNIEEFIT